jgi:asparaginyl-tRNA synthetase
MRSQLTFATHSFFQENGFLCVHTPIVTTNDCEGAGEMFQVTTLFSQAQKADKELLKLKLSEISRNNDDDDGGSVGFDNDFFRRQAFLTVSGQLHAEPYACALSRVYTFGPTFRAENSHTSRHLAEFWMVEPEMAFANLQVCPLYNMYAIFTLVVPIAVLTKTMQCTGYYELCRKLCQAPLPVVAHALPGRHEVYG